MSLYTKRLLWVAKKHGQPAQFLCSLERRLSSLRKHASKIADEVARNSQEKILKLTVDKVLFMFAYVSLLFLPGVQKRTI
jgi:hypothetical protein